MKSNDVITLARYTNIVLEILKELKKISLVKLVFLSFCMKNCVSQSDNLTKSKYDLFSKLMRHFNAQYNLKSREFIYVFESINLLNKSGYIDINEREVTLTNRIIHSYMDEDFLKYRMLFKEVEKMNDVWFLEEIIANV